MVILFMFNRITMQLLISRKAAIIQAWFFSSHWRLLCHAERKFVAQPMQVWFYSSTQLPAPGLMIFSSFGHCRGWWVYFKVTETVSENFKSHWHWSHRLAIEHCFSTLFWTSVSTQAKKRLLDVYIVFREDLPGSSGSAFLQVKQVYGTPFLTLLIYFRF